MNHPAVLLSDFIFSAVFAVCALLLPTSVFAKTMPTVVYRKLVAGCSVGDTVQGTWLGGWKDAEITSIQGSTYKMKWKDNENLCTTSNTGSFWGGQETQNNQGSVSNCSRAASQLRNMAGTPCATSSAHSDHGSGLGEEGGSNDTTVGWIVGGVAVGVMCIGAGLIMGRNVSSTKDDGPKYKNRISVFDDDFDNDPKANAAAVKIQARRRGAIARAETHEEIIKRRHAATKLQANFRGNMVRQQTNAQIAERRQAATKMQANFRGNQARQRTQEMGFERRGSTKSNRKSANYKV